MMKKKSEDRKDKDRKSVEAGHSGPQEGISPAEQPAGEDLAAKLREKEKEAAENYERYMRAVADLENYKKYAAKDRADILKYANERIIKDLLPILDGLDRALSHSNEVKDVDTFIEGVRIIKEQLLAFLERHGVKRVESVGQTFDPERHEAFMLTESDEHEEGTVVEELEAGYMLNDRLLRAAKVAVSKKKTAGEKGQEKNQSEGG
ncbi:MAG TPA: nucleotide exchange factor GrpE [Syntrophales bacterium]|nr:nucleotide exchange factor GrpE [Syntrophobacterales bacterium]HRR40935.1 nucleotide exchange factor GrpE [Syntrophales bacterium]HRT70009.1 nucleotide exchange factor GrpE [Syntrophales bacterium]